MIQSVIMKVVRGSQMTYIPASHEDSLNPEVWKKVLLTYKDVNPGSFQMVNWAKLPVGKKFRAHYHEDMEEIFIILSGKVRVRCGDENAILEKGDTVTIPPKKIHEMENLIDQDVEYIVIGIVEGVHGKTIIV